MQNPTYKKGFFTSAPSAEAYLGDLRADGTVALTANWDVGSYTLTALRFISDQATGTAPFTVASTTVVANLNASLLGGNAASAFVKVDGTVPLTAAWTTAYPLYFPVGSAAAPSMSFVGYTNTGWYYNTAGRIYAAVGGVNIAYFYSGGMTIETGKNFSIDGGKITSHVIANGDSDTNEIDSYTFSGGYGLVIAACSTDSATAVWRLEATTLTAISVNAAFTATKDNAATYNVYFESGALKLQNKVGDNKVVYVGFYGI